MSTPSQIGPYRIDAILEQEAYGDLYRAIAPDDSPIALRVLTGALAASSSYRDRLSRERSKLLDLSHSAVVPILEIGEADDFTYFASPFLAAGSLADRLREAPLPSHIALRVVSRVATALDAIHAAGLLHRNLRATAVRFDDTGLAHLGDLGLPTLPELDRKPPGDEIKEALAHMSPEQIRQEPLDAQSDVYSLGIIGFEALTGVLPYRASNPDALAAQHFSKPVPSVMEALRGFRLGPSDIHVGASDPPILPSVDEVFSQALAKNPDDRYDVATQFAAALAEVIRPDFAPPPPAPSTAPLDPLPTWDWDSLSED